MFCKECGNEIGANARFCKNCGSAVVYEDVRPTPDKRSTNNRIWILAIFAVAVFAVVAAVAYFMFFGVNSSPEKVVVAYIESSFENDINMLLKCYPDCTIRTLAEAYDLDETASRKEVEKSIERMDDTEARSVKIVSVEVVKQGDVSDFYITRGLYDMSKQEYNSITQVARVEAEYVTNGDIEYSTEITCIEMDNKWYVLTLL